MTAPTIDITYVTAPVCHLCRHGREVLDRLAADYPLVVTEFDMTSPEGARLAAAARAPFPPMVIFDGRLVAHGRLSEKQLRRELDRVAVTTAPASTARTGQGD